MLKTNSIAPSHQDLLNHINWRNYTNADTYLQEIRAIFPGINSRWDKIEPRLILSNNDTLEKLHSDLLIALKKINKADDDLIDNAFIIRLKISIIKIKQRNKNE